MKEEKCFIRTGIDAFDQLIPLVESFLEKDSQEVIIDGDRIRGYRSPDAPSIWIRDYSDMLRGIRYFDKDVKSTIQHFADTQAANGRVFDYFTTSPEKLPCEKENWTKYVRVPVEADVEYRFVKAAFLAWQATGDDEWIKSLMPNLEKAIGYALGHPDRFDKSRNLVKRPYTIDTWDFAYTAGKHNWLQFQIDENTYWGFFHGDNSGYFEVLKMMSILNNHLGYPDQAEKYSNLAERIKTACNQICWNGSYYSHFVKITPCIVPGVEEDNQLSMSNPMAINRGITNIEQSRSIIREYLSRWEGKEGYFAEWFSIDPPFPDGVFGDEKLIGGAYINGGIFPLAGGELARAAFDCGYESYGVDILKRYYNLVRQKGGSWLWYFPDGSQASEEKSTSPEASSTDGWGSTAMLNALIEGLAGIVDQSRKFELIKLSPKWAAAKINNAHVKLTYPASDAYIEYQYMFDNKCVALDIKSSGSSGLMHILLPEKHKIDRLEVNGADLSFSAEKSGPSNYINFRLDNMGSAKILIFLDHE